MIGQSLVFVCAAVALVAGSCYDGSVIQGVAGVAYPSVMTTGIAAPACGCYGLPSGVSASGTIVSGFPSVVATNGLTTGTVVSGLPAAITTSGLTAPITEGPATIPVNVVQAAPVTLPTVTSPVITISSQPVPAPRVISQRCICTKTIVKPQIIQREITAPKIQRYLKRTVTPVVENIVYKTSPYSTKAGAASTTYRTISTSGSRVAAPSALVTPVSHAC